MPCAEGMRRCRRDCLHRRLVLNYRDARDAYERWVEEVSIGYETEAAQVRQEHPGITFKDWLLGHAGTPVL